MVGVVGHTPNHWLVVTIKIHSIMEGYGIMVITKAVRGLSLIILVTIVLVSFGMNTPTSVEAQTQTRTCFSAHAPGANGYTWYLRVSPTLVSPASFYIRKSGDQYFRLLEQSTSQVWWQTKHNGTYEFLVKVGYSPLWLDSNNIDNNQVICRHSFRVG